MTKYLKLMFVFVFSVANVCGLQGSAQETPLLPSYPAAYEAPIQPGVYGSVEDGILTVSPVIEENRLEAGVFYTKHAVRIEAFPWENSLAPQETRVLEWDLDAKTLSSGPAIPLLSNSLGEHQVYSMRTQKPASPSGIFQQAWDAEVRVLVYGENKRLQHFSVQMTQYRSSGPIFVSGERSWKVVKQIESHFGSPDNPAVLLLSEGFYKIDFTERRSGVGAGLFGADTYLSVRMSEQGSMTRQGLVGSLQIFVKPENQKLQLLSEGPFQLRDGMLTGYTWNGSTGDLFLDLRDALKSIWAKDSIQILNGKMKVFNEVGPFDLITLTPIVYSPSDLAEPPTEK